VEVRWAGAEDGLALLSAGAGGELVLFLFFFSLSPACRVAENTNRSTTIDAAIHPDKAALRVLRMFIEFSFTALVLIGGLRLCHSQT
jgi:hypothetical protein